jgi:hypothetical protein
MENFIPHKDFYTYGVMQNDSHLIQRKQRETERGYVMDLITGTKGHVNLFNEESCVCKYNPAPLTNFGHDVITMMFRKLIRRPCRHTWQVYRLLV